MKSSGNSSDYADAILLGVIASVTACVTVVLFDKVPVMLASRKQRTSGSEVPLADEAPSENASAANILLAAFTVMLVFGIVGFIVLTLTDPS